MKLLIDSYGFNWRMFGLLGKNAEWFFGFSKRTYSNEISPDFLAEIIDKESK